MTWEIIMPPSGLTDVMSLPISVQQEILTLTDRLKTDPGLVDPTLRKYTGQWDHHIDCWTVRLWIDAEAQEVRVLRVLRR